MKRLVLALVLVCSCTRYVSQPEQPSVPPPAAAKIFNRAAEPCSLIVQHVSEEAKCSLWSGRETALPDEVDAVLCVLPNGLLYCDAPDNGKPELQVVADWTPTPTQPEPATGSPPVNAIPGRAETKAPKKK